MNEFSTYLQLKMDLLIYNTIVSLRRSVDKYGEGNGTPLQHSCLENPTDRGAWWATVDGVAKNIHTYKMHIHLCIHDPMTSVARGNKTVLFDPIFTIFGLGT